MSLVDPSVPPPGSALPPGHPFVNVPPSVFWSTTTDAGSPTEAWNVYFFDGGNVFVDPKLNSRHVWCVRGPMQESVY